MTDFKGVTVCKTKEDYEGITNKDPDRLYVVENEDLVKLYHNLGQHTDGAVDQKTVTDAVNANQAVFVAQYGVTSYDDIKDALDAGKIVIAKDSAHQYIASYIIDGDVTFTSPYTNINYTLTVHRGGTWTTNSNVMQSTAYKVTSLSPSSGDHEYPSAKCTYDAIKTVDNRVTTVANSIPTALSQLSGDASHRTVTDSEKSSWNGRFNRRVECGKVAVSKGNHRYWVWNSNGNVPSTIQLTVYSGGDWSGDPPTVTGLYVDGFSMNHDSSVVQGVYWLAIW